jgi:hypothetical protein
MKRGIYSQKIENRATKLISRFINSKGVYILLALAALVLLSGASEKWGR